MPELHNQMYCPDCAVNQYQEDEDVCFDFHIRTNLTEPGLLEVSCARCGEGAIYSITYLKSTHGSTQRTNKNE